MAARPLRASAVYIDAVSGWGCFPYRFAVAPVKSITSVEYLDPSPVDPSLPYTAINTNQYELETSSNGSARLTLTALHGNQTHLESFEAIRITHTAGYESAAAVPSDYIEAVLCQLSLIWGDLTPAEVNAYERCLQQHMAAASWGYC